MPVMLTRRDVALGLPAAALAPATALAAPVGLKVGVVGAGVFGSWIAHELQRAGCAVMLFDQYGPANARASSGGESRLLRAGYGPDTIYSDWAIRSHRMWLETLQAVSHTECFVQCGALWLSRPGDPYGIASEHTLKSLNWPIQILDRGELRRRYPVIEVPVACEGILELRSGALLARRAVAAVVADFVRKGGSLVQARASLDHEALLVNGEHLMCDRIVVSVGPWLPKLLPEVIGRRLTPTRQEIVFFGPPAGNVNYSPERLPAWVDFTDSRIPYGFPDLEARGFKMSFDRHGAVVDPDTEERIVSPQLLAEAREYLAIRFPELARSPLVESRVCQYENTDSGDFILDWHPQSRRVFIAGGGSGHGFKHGPAIGEHVAQVLTGQQALIERFKIPEVGATTREVH